MMEHSNFHLGTAGWSYDEWVGVFYPEFTTRDRYLQEYSKYFNAVEVMSTARKIPSRDAITRWRNNTPDNFKFAMTAPLSLFSETSPWKPGRDFTNFLKGCELLGGNLGPILLELPWHTGISHLPDASTLFKNLPSGFVYAVEPGNSEWNHEFFYEVLRDCGISMVHSNLSDIETAHVDTADTVYIRMKGRKKKTWQDYSELRIDKRDEMRKWASRVARIVTADRPVYIFFTNQYAGFAPGSAELFKRKVKTVVSTLEGEE